MSEGLEYPTEPAHRPRRAHKKSRNGCLRCKQRKTKCDEGSPSCLRCSKRGLSCQYQKVESQGSASGGESQFGSRLKPDESRPVLRNLVPAQQCYAVSSDGTMLPTPCPSPSQTQSPLSTLGVEKLFVGSFLDGVLESTDLELFNHYLTHTSLVIPLDIDDLYALRIGIPNLAFRSQPVMDSILALSAVCKSHDLIQQHYPDKSRILDLLQLADQHHRASLVEVQLDLSNPRHYDYVLANATLMVLYASSSHCVRIRLAELYRSDETVPRDVIPAHSQWISLIRAAHLAFAGLFNDQSDPDDFQLRLEDKGSSASSPLPLPPSSHNSQTGSSTQNIISPEDGPTERTKGLLFPILVASYTPALKDLRTKAWATWNAKFPGLSREFPDSMTGDLALSCTSQYASASASAYQNLQACFSALDILNSIMTEIFSPLTSTSSPPTTSSPKPFYPELDIATGGLATVSGWLRGYVARVTSATTSPRPLRRVIMAFLNRVPAEFLNLVQVTLDSIPPSSDDEPISWTYPDPISGNGNGNPNSSAAHKLAIDIFAHWLVLVILLDGVWWIGGIGAWELRRVVGFVRVQGWVEGGEYWWPESMGNVGREISLSPRI